MYIYPEIDSLDLYLPTRLPQHLLEEMIIKEEAISNEMSITNLYPIEGIIKDICVPSALHFPVIFLHDRINRYLSSVNNASREGYDELCPCMTVTTYGNVHNFTTLSLQCQHKLKYIT